MQTLIPKEEEIMNIFWKLDCPFIISDILKANPDLSRNTVAKVLVSLEKKGYIKVNSIRKTVTRTGRAYIAAITKKEYEEKNALIKAVSDGTSMTQATLSFLSTLLQSENLDDSFLSELEAMILEYKNQKE